MSPASVRILGSSNRSLIGLLIPRIVFLNEPSQLVQFQQKFLRMCVQRSRLTCAQDAAQDVHRAFGSQALEVQTYSKELPLSSATRQC